MMDHTHKAFDSDLQELGRMVAEMGGLAEQQIVDAVDALSRRDGLVAPPFRFRRSQPKLARALHPPPRPAEPFHESWHAESQPLPATIMPPDYSYDMPGVVVAPGGRGRW